MLHFTDPDYLQAVRDFADAQGIRDNLEETLNYLDHYGEPGTTRCTIGPDFAPHSFTLVMERNGRPLWYGGMIYQGPRQPLDGSGPAFTVSLGAPKQGWSIHT
jgi:hypothetical protein